MQAALDTFEIKGVGHNIPFLSAVMQCDRFERGDISTNYIAEEYPDGFEGVALNPGHARAIASVCTLMAQKLAERAASGSGILTHHDRKIPTDVCVHVGEQHYEIKTERTNGSSLVTSTDDSDKAAIELEISTAWAPGQSLVTSLIDNEPFVFAATPIPEGYRIQYRGSDVEVKVRTPAQADLAKLMPEKIVADTSNLLLCPMPGVIVSILVEEGDEVQDGQALAVVEAMKMENTLRAEKKAIVSRVCVQAGDNRAVDEIIMEFEAPLK